MVVKNASYRGFSIGKIWDFSDNRSFDVDVTSIVKKQCDGQHTRMKAYLIDYFWTSCRVYCFDSAKIKTILVNYNLTYLLRFFKFFVFFYV